MLFLLDVALYTGHWVLNKTLNGAYYMVYGVPKDPVVAKIEELESILEKNRDQTPNHKFYWAIKDNYSDYHWLVISQTKVIGDYESKSEALRLIADREEKDKHHDCLLVQVGSEEHMYSI